MQTPALLTPVGELSRSAHCQLIAPVRQRLDGSFLRYKKNQKQKANRNQQLTGRIQAIGITRAGTATGLQGVSRCIYFLPIPYTTVPTVPTVYHRVP